MPSYGESDIIVNACGVGRLSVANLAPGTAIFPRLTFTVECLLYETSGGPPGPVYSNLQLTDLRGELRWSQHAHALGRLDWDAEKKTASGKFPTSFQMVCDLDPYRLEGIERRRNGGPPTFFIQFWPAIAGKGETYLAHCRAFPLTIPRDRWIEVVNQIRDVELMVVEIDVGKKHDGPFRRAYNHLNDAREKIDAGDFGDAATACRRAVEALVKVLPKVAKDQEPIAKFISQVLNEHRAEAYGAAARSVRRFGGSGTHDYDPLPITRAEARLVLSTTANLISLLASLKQTQKKNQEMV